jgi:hypothetical protein
MKTIKIDFIDSVPSHFTGIIEYPNGDKFWYKKGNIHREDGPAIEASNGSKYWFKEGNYHREDGPARIFSDGTKSWYKEGKRHRLDGPAIEFLNGLKEWWIDNIEYNIDFLNLLYKEKIYLGKEKGKYNLEWLKFLTEEGIEEFPIMPEMKEYKDFKKVFEKLEGIGNK